MGLTEYSDRRDCTPALVSLARDLCCSVEEARSKLADGSAATELRMIHPPGPAAASAWLDAHCDPPG